MDTPPTITHVSHCAGYEGIGLGLRRVIPGLRTIAYGEIEAFALANLVAKIEAGQLDAAPLWTDIKTFPFADFHGLVDIYSAGFPCQPFSAAGKRGADEDPRHLFPFIRAGVERMRPGVVFLENVEGIISAKLAGDGWNDPAGTPVLLHVLRELERLGYRATAGVFSASEVGAPHQRKRVFIMAVRASERRGEGRAESERVEGRLDAAECSEPALAHHHHQRSQGHGRPIEVLSPQGREDEGRYTSESCFPSRPGEQQFAWEPPRTVANAERSDKTRRVATRREESSGWAHNQSGGSGGARVADAEHRRHDGIALTVAGQSEQDSDRAAECGEGLADSIRLHGTGGEREIRRGRRVCESGENCGADKDRQTQPALGGDFNGTSGRLDYAELCDSRVDELRLLGNGCVPATVERAFRVLAARLTE